MRANMCIYMHVYIHICVCTHMRRMIYAYTHTHTCRLIQIHIYTNVDVSSIVYAFICLLVVAHYVESTHGPGATTQSWE